MKPATEWVFSCLEFEVANVPYQAKAWIADVAMALIDTWTTSLATSI